jgi:hypothetical protein
MKVGSYLLPEKPEPRAILAPCPGSPKRSSQARLEKSKGTTMIGSHDGLTSAEESITPDLQTLSDSGRKRLSRQ